jgi:prepilin peptidase CpaA
MPSAVAVQHAAAVDGRPERKHPDDTDPGRRPDMNHLLTPSLIANTLLIVLCLLLVGAVWTDVRERRIFNRLVFAGAFAGLVFNTVLPEGLGFASALPGALGFWDALAGLATGLGLMLPLYLLRAMGAGDVKLMAMVGAFLGPRATVGVVLATFIVGGVMIVAVVLRKGTLGRLLDNLRTMLLASFFKLMMHEAPTVDAANTSAGKMPYALAIAAGTIIYITFKSTGNDLPWFLDVVG